MNYSHKEIILKNLTAKKYAEISVDFLIKITNESERGAILIGGSKIDEYLEELVVQILPESNKSYQNRLLKYPGPLSSFSGKIELLYAFKYIDKRFYNSLNTLRKIRNEAAHSSNNFSIQSIKAQLDIIYDFEPDFKDAAYQSALENLIKFKLHNLKQNFEDKNLHLDFDYLQLWNERVPDPEKDPEIVEQLTIWKLSYGLVFLCLKIEAIINEVKEKRVK